MLEHVADDVGLLSGLSDLLWPEGFLIVSTPMWPDLLSPEEVSHGHIRRYSVDSLTTLFRQAGVRPVAATGYVVSLLPLARIHRRRVAAGKAALATETATPPLLLNEALAWWVSGEGALAGYIELPTGLSTITVLRRDQ